MAGNKWAQIFFVAMLVVGFGAERSMSAAENKEIKAADAIHIDIPVVLKEANVVFNMDHLAFAGDLPVGINYMHLLPAVSRNRGLKAGLSASSTVMQRT